MSVSTGRGPLPTSVASRYPHGYAVVDVETSGLSPTHHRVLQVAVTQVEPDGALGRSWSSLLDPGVDPGPVHVHGLTRERLAGAPQYQDVAGTLDELVRDRVLVAHNARFDWGFLAAESDRARAPLSVDRRLCTLALSRRLDLPVSDLRLATVAAHWGVQQRRAHDAEDDVRVLVEVLRHSLAAADRLGMTLPVAACGPGEPSARDGGPVRPSPSPRVPCDWAWPGRWDGASPWVQGMKIVFTGPTERPRDDLVRLAVGAGLDVMNSASSRTSVVVCATPAATTRKLAAARAHGIEIVDERVFLDLVGRVVPGRPVGAARQVPAVEGALRPSGPLTGRRVLVVGGTHTESSAVRERVVAAGGRAAVNLTAAVTDVVGLPGAVADPRWSRIESTAAVDHLDPVTLTPVAPPRRTVQPPAGTGALPSAAAAAPPARRVVHGADVPVLPRGGVLDLPDVEQWSLSVRRPENTSDVDVVAFVTDDLEKVADDSGLVFFNSPEHPSGSVSVAEDAPGETLVAIDLELLPEGATRIVVAASTEGETAFGEVGPIELVLRDVDGTQVVRSTLDAGTVERSMVLAVVYRRGTAWRFRAVGQGYESGLADLVRLFGVAVDG
ncbi:DNA polymerase III epsilon subunit-like 3'-5' exonuclease [Sanguibacter keddieii DSM 10542]|uniref:DNA polymerase III epsilon subunit-like 3'-5' exonuclease n=1 Tax=Sanguibacter keddieii (strain ATCC 51767 / DSM 10542 / NCFB 3025 / ST-74) TaxID=446469 RepID=D1BFD5_SANKS|nr:TerD family protein [Sanguibacter keddieii]ACZ23438.1 DNA polymerase III epsilon subunit-like 3'-5' exonuclease [Sanguibacter keddieii DSM 10542]